MRPFINLSLNFAPHEITKGLQSFELGGQISLDQWSFRLAFSQSWAILAVLGGQATKSTVLMRPKNLFCVNFELGGQTSLDQGSFRLAFSQPWWFWLCFGWPGHKIHCLCEAKDIFYKILDRNGICLPSILVLVQNLLQKVNQGPVLFLETLQSPVDVFRRAKLLGLPHKFCTLPRYFCKYQ